MNETLLEYELHTVKREIQTHGTFFRFVRQKLDDYGEVAEGVEESTEVNGIYHTEKGYLSQTTGDGTITHSKGQPCILCLYEDTANIEVGDRTILNDKVYTVVGKNNIQQYNIVCDLSLEVMQSVRAENKG